LAGFDPFGETTHGDRLPPLRFGEFACGVDNALPAFGPLAFLARVSGHVLILALLDKLSKLDYDRY
jgi:hypothetical protein